MFESEDEKFDDEIFDDGPQEEVVSLEGLSRAFAEAIERSDEDADDEPAGDTEIDAGEVESDDADSEPVEELPESYSDVSGGDDSCPISPQTILEAVLFVGNEENRALESSRAAALMRGVEAEDIPDLVNRLNRRYESNGCPYKIYAEGSGYRLRLAERFHPLRDKFYGRIREARLSQAAIDVLAIVAYSQPITVDGVNRLRDKRCNHILSQLVRRRLLQIERPEDRSNKPLYRTTGRFLELFGLDSINELPQSESISTSDES